MPYSCEDEGMPGEVYVPVGAFGDQNYLNPRYIIGSPKGSDGWTATIYYGVSVAYQILIIQEEV